MKVHQIMNKKPVYVSLDARFIEIWNILFKKHTHAVPVVDKNNYLKGIIATEDVLTKLYPSYSDTMEEFLRESTFEELEEKIEEIKNLKAKDIMCKEVHCAYPDDPILKALSKMVVRRVRQLPVIDYKGKLLGIISKRDIFDKFFLSKLLKRS